MMGRCGDQVCNIHHGVAGFERVAKSGCLAGPRFADRVGVAAKSRAALAVVVARGAIRSAGQIIDEDGNSAQRAGRELARQLLERRHRGA